MFFCNSCSDGLFEYKLCELVPLCLPLWLRDGVEGELSG